jgi:hypothetical protein
VAVSNTDQADVDWAAGVRRERRRGAATFVLATLALVAVLLVRFDPARPDDRGFVLAVGAVLLATAVGAAAWFVAGIRAGQTDRYRAFYALREHVDPGPGVRRQADDLARRLKSQRWAAWLLPLPLAIQLVPGRWDEPGIAVTGTVVYAVCLVTVAWWQHSLGAAAHRWLGDPPGPPRRQDEER